MKNFKKANELQEKLRKWLPKYIAWKISSMVL